MLYCWNMRKRGPKFKLSAEEVQAVKKELDENQTETVDAIARRFGVSRTTVYNAVRKLEAQP